MNVNLYNTMDYERKRDWTLGESKPNSNPIKPNCRKVKMNASSCITKDYRKKDDFVVRINKPNFRNGQNERKLNFNKGLQKKRLFRSPKNKPNSNPISAESLLNMLINFVDNTSYSLDAPRLISGTGYSYLGRRKIPLKTKDSAKKETKWQTNNLG